MSFVITEYCRKTVKKPRKKISTITIKRNQLTCHLTGRDLMEDDDEVMSEFSNYYVAIYQL